MKKPAPVTLYHVPEDPASWAALAHTHLLKHKRWCFDGLTLTDDALIATGPARVRYALDSGACVEEEEPEPVRVSGGVAWYISPDGAALGPQGQRVRWPYPLEGAVGGADRLWVWGAGGVASLR